SLGDGETRFIESSKVTEQLQEVLGLFDVIVGTEEEFHICGGSIDTVEALKAVRQVSDAELVCKRGALGCSVYTDAIPATLDEGITITGVRVDVLNVLGAGDAFMSGLLRGYINGEGWEKACAYANACGALVVSRHGCAPAMPTKLELDNYLARAESVKRPDLDSELNHLHRVTTRKQQWPELCVMAFDHRIQFVNMAREVGADVAQIKPLKKLILEASRQVSIEADLIGKSGLLCDSSFGQDVLNDITGDGWWIGRPIELPGSRPLKMEHGNIGSQLIDWPKEHVVKCLCFYNPEDEYQIRLEQEHQVREVYEACCKSGHELLLEIILPEGIEKSDQLYFRAMTRFYNLGIKPDWWKLPPLAAQTWDQVSELVNARDEHCRGVVILGLDAPQEELAKGFAQTAGKDIVKGFMVGRTLFGEPSREWLAGQISDQTLINKIKINYHNLIELWNQQRG
ncbi:5-dehydro-2-deoxygluconokinase, partial [Vibrio ponticus]